MKCSKCKEDKEASNFAKNKAKSRGHDYVCKQCRNKNIEELKTKVRLDERVKEKFCIQCEETKQAVFFTNDSRIRGGLCRMCKDCKNSAGSRATWINLKIELEQIYQPFERKAAHAKSS